MNKVVFAPNQNDFYNTLRKEVYQYFKDNNIEKTGNEYLYLKSVVLIGFLLYAYIHLVFFTPSSTLGGLLLCILLGFDFALIGFNVSHDACHGSYSKSTRLNDFLGYTFNMMGVSSFFWRTKHNLVHHTFTNIDGVDADIIQTKLLRLAPTQEKRAIHRFQHWYCMPIYAISYMVWVFYNDFEKYFSGHVQNSKFINFTLREHLIFWLSKAVYACVFLILPMYMCGWQQTLTGYVVGGLACGLLLGSVFQLAHIVEKTEFEDATQADLMVENEWAIHQFYTTANFAPTNPLVTWFLGGLNFQVEHHIFTKISHVHYPKIRPIIKSVCERFEVPYNEYPSMFDAMRSHFRQMKMLGVA